MDGEDFPVYVESAYRTFKTPPKCICFVQEAAIGKKALIRFDFNFGHEVSEVLESPLSSLNTPQRRPLRVPSMMHFL